MQTIRILSLYVALLLSLGCGSDDPTLDSADDTENIFISDESEGFEMVGGTKFDPNSAKGIGKFFKTNKSASCTLTRISKRHFITASHCVDWLKNLANPTIGIQGALGEVAKWKGNKFIIDKKRMYASSFKKPTTQKEEDKLFKEGWEDIAIFSLDHTKLENSAKITKYLNANFNSYAEIAPTSEKILIPSLYKIVGWGTNRNTSNVIATCTGPASKRVCVDPFDSNDFSSGPDPAGQTDLKFGLFRANEVGPKGSNNSIGLKMLTSIRIEKEGKITLPKSATSWGFIAPGDSGGPMLNSKGQLLGVNSVTRKGQSSKDGMWFERPHFISKMNRDFIMKKIDRAIIDSHKAEVELGDSFVVFGYKLNKLKPKILGTNKLIPTTACYATKLAEYQKVIAGSGFKEYEDYMCFLATFDAYTKDRTIVLEEEGNKDLNYRSTLKLKAWIPPKF